MILITGSLGLIGFTACKYYLDRGKDVVGIDNDKRKSFLGDKASNFHKLNELHSYEKYTHVLKDLQTVSLVDFKDIEMIIHCAAQPSHDYATDFVLDDFHNNATATIKLLEGTKRHHPHALFIFLSSNKVYGDVSAEHKFIEYKTRYDLFEKHRYYHGFDETIGIDGRVKSFYGASKASADLYCQEFANYHGLKTYVLRGSCLTGSMHSGVEKHGFLSHLVNCHKEKRPYRIIGHQGKQIRDNLHAHDVVRAFDCIYQQPQDPGVYNLGGGRDNAYSILELIEEFLEVEYSYNPVHRIGDFKWWITDNSKFIKDYPAWQVCISTRGIMMEMLDDYGIS